MGPFKAIIYRKLYGSTYGEQFDKIACFATVSADVSIQRFAQRNTFSSWPHASSYKGVRCTALTGATAAAAQEYVSPSATRVALQRTARPKPVRQERLSCGKAAPEAAGAATQPRSLATVVKCLLRTARRPLSKLPLSQAADGCSSCRCVRRGAVARCRLGSSALSVPYAHVL